MKRPWYILTVPTKLLGLTTAVYEIFFTDSPAPEMLVVSAALMGMGEAFDTILGNMSERDPVVEPPKPKRSLHAPETTYVAGVYIKYQILNLDPRSPWPNWSDFARDVRDALLADDPSLRLEPASNNVYTNDQWMELSDQERQWSLIENGTPTIIQPTPTRPKPDPMVVVLQPGERIINSYNIAATKAKQIQERARNSRASRLRRYNRP